jgi:drug/metabolite transporter (DMT)-like permease
MPRMSTRDWWLLILLSVLWGGSFFFVGVARPELPPLTLVWLRVALAALVLALTLPAIGIAIPRDRRAWVAFAGMALLNNVIPFTLIVWAQGHIASGLAAILNATTPIFTVLVAHALTRDERLSGSKAAGVAAGVAGVVVLIGPAALSGLGAGPEIAMLGATLSYAFAGIFGRRFKRMGIAPEAGALGQVACSTLLVLPLMLTVERPWTLPQPSVVAMVAVLGLAVISTALAYVVYFRLLATAGATNLLLVTFLIPVTAILLGVAVLGETLLWRHVAGMALIAAGLVAIDGRLVARKAPDP